MKSAAWLLVVGVLLGGGAAARAQVERGETRLGVAESGPAPQTLPALKVAPEKAPPPPAQDRQPPPPPGFNHRTACEGAFLDVPVVQPLPDEVQRTVYVEEIVHPDGTITRREHVVKQRVRPAPPPMGFPQYPYPLGLPGYMQVDPTPVGQVTGDPNEVLYLRPWSVRLSLENGNDFDGLNRVNGIAFIDSKAGVGLYTSWNLLHERWDGGTADGVLGSITVTFRVVETEQFLLRWGIGANVYTDDWWSEAGINFHLGADFFPAQPWVFSGVVEVGNLGDLDVIHLRGTTGYLIDRCEIFAGYDWVRIERFDIHGPLLGLRVWF
jgi:hypothetical protein